MTTVTERACNWKHLLCIKESEDPCPDALRVLRLGLAGSAVTYVVFVFSKQFGVNKGLRAAQAWRALALPRRPLCRSAARGRRPYKLVPMMCTKLKSH